MFFVSNSDTTLNVNNAKTKGIQTQIRGGTITAADTTNTYDSALNVSVTLNDTSDSGACVYKLIEGVATNTDITGWDELYLLHLTGASTFYVDNAGNVALSATKKLYLDGGGNTYITESSADVLRLYSGGNIAFEATGGTDTAVVAQRTISLAPNQAGAGGNVSIIGDAAISAGRYLYLDGGGDTYIYENSADAVIFKVGGDSLMVLSEDGAEGNQVWFKASAAGFTQQTTTYNASDTDVEFFTTNKQSVTFGSGNITDMNIYFPDVSANVLLKLTQDGTGSRTVTNWKSFDQAGGNAGTVKWAGGAAPTLSTGANAVDIISFYWDNTNNTAYGVARLNFS